jgi:hypothetical protein
MYFKMQKHEDNTVKHIIPYTMNETKCEKMYHSNPQEGAKNIACIGEESYLNELMLNSKSIQRMQEFIENLDSIATNHM